MGGIHAQNGFDYQDSEALYRVPGWLRNPLFEGLIVEGFEDIEARFFAPHAPQSHVLVRLQAKSGQPDTAEVREVLEKFAAFDAVHPDVVKVHILLTVGLPQKLKWLAVDGLRVRKARPFYSPFAGVMDATHEEFRKNCAEEFGAAVADFATTSVEVVVSSTCDRPTAEAKFSAALFEHFPAAGSLGTARLAFRALTDLLSRDRGTLITAAQLRAALSQSLGVDVFGAAVPRLHIRSDRNGEDDRAVEVDASEFSGVDGCYPPPADWQSGLLVPLGRIARWAAAHGLRRFEVVGSYRLSTAFSVGWSLRSAVGFELDIQTRSGAWQTDDRPGAGLPSPWSIKQPQALVGARLIVAVGVIRSPVAATCAALGLVNDEALLVALLPQAITTGADAQAFVGAIKGAVDEAVARLRPAQIAIYFVGPAALAVALGHRWNGMPATQLHEFIASSGAYVPTALLG